MPAGAPVSDRDAYSGTGVSQSAQLMFFPQLSGALTFGPTLRILESNVDFHIQNNSVRIRGISFSSTTSKRNA